MAYIGTQKHHVHHSHYSASPFEYLVLIALWYQIRDIRMSPERPPNAMDAQRQSVKQLGIYIYGLHASEYNGSIDVSVVFKYGLHVVELYDLRTEPLVPDIYIYI